MPEIVVKTHKYGNTQANIPDGSSAAIALDAARDLINDEDLAGQGRDVEGNHVTVRYGIMEDDCGGIAAFLTKQKPFEAELGSTEMFPPTEHSDGAAVIKAPVTSLELRRINALLPEYGKFKPADFEYSPHATIAYVKPEAVVQYIGLSVTNGRRFLVDTITISKRTGEQVDVKLTGAQTTAFGPQGEPITTRFDPDQPRDKDGKFGSGGTSSWTDKDGNRKFPTHSSVIETSPFKSGPREDYKNIKTSAFEAVKSAPVQEVSVDTLVTGQPALDASRLSTFDKSTAPPIEILRYKGNDWIVQGNHRAASAWVAGEKTISAHVLNLDSAPKYLKNTERFLGPQSEPLDLRFSEDQPRDSDGRFTGGAEHEKLLADAKDAVVSGGGEWKGVQKDENDAPKYATFNSPSTGSTYLLPLSGLTSEAVKAHIEKKDAAFKAHA